ncbi:MAG: hypothetical protein E7E64_10365 [Clostridium celatum]|uniref:hypothetical protein n=1 Tax=Clostridium sp. TaxID=1506 RepID=UPI0025E851E0|nr:hypothetical protein [uncultured Clostridium sp.]MDU2122934.1 hypothetical protein [Clostridium celatum]MDU4883742.1 hypothetical protein [Clostridium celatum]MDU4980643.1 hypothetical protein [Clostridium celatum]MDU7076986.1 hypothetical protein [Clostridium celatum]
MFLFDEIMFLLNKEDVYIGYSIEDVSNIVGILKKNNIKYKHKIVKLLRNDERFSLRRVNVDMNYETQYTISVKQSDYKKAKYLIDKRINK